MVLILCPFSLMQRRILDNTIIQQSSGMMLTVATILLAAAALTEAVCTPNEFYAPTSLSTSADGDDACKLKVKQCPDFHVSTACGDYTHQFSEDVYFGFRCENNGNACETIHLPFEGLLMCRMCVPKTGSRLSETVTVSKDGCTDTITIEYYNITSCACDSVGIEGI